MQAQLYIRIFWGCCTDLDSGLRRESKCVNEDDSAPPCHPASAEALRCEVRAARNAGFSFWPQEGATFSVRPQCHCRHTGASIIGLPRKLFQIQHPRPRQCFNSPKRERRPQNTRNAVTLRGICAPGLMLRRPQLRFFARRSQRGIL